MPRGLLLLTQCRLRRAPALDGNLFDQADCSLVHTDLGSACARAS